MRKVIFALLLVAMPMSALANGVPRRVLAKLQKLSTGPTGEFHTGGAFFRPYTVAKVEHTNDAVVVSMRNVLLSKAGPRFNRVVESSLRIESDGSQTATQLITGYKPEKHITKITPDSRFVSTNSAYGDSVE